MITKLWSETTDGKKVIHRCKITLFGITIYKGERSSTNSNAIKQLIPSKESIKIKGFNNED